MKINILLPYKEEYLNQNAGAVSILVSEQLKFSKFKKDIRIFGISRNSKLKIKNFIVLKQSKFFRNFNYVKEFSILIGEKKSLIELHNRPAYFNYLKKKLPYNKYFLFFHNDPTELDGSKSIKERQYIYENCDKIIFLSNWIKDRFFYGLKIFKTDNFLVFYPGADKVKKIPKKENIIVFIGKLNSAKGYDIFCEATRKFIKKNKKWKVISAGFEARRNLPNYSHVKELGQIDHFKVNQLLKVAKISIAPSRWNEPLGRLPIESASKACVCISSNTGGLLESNKNGIIVNSDINEVFKNLNKLANDSKFYNKLQKKIFSNFSYLLKTQNKIIDNLRSSLINKRQILQKKFNKKKYKILHISNFNENSDGRLFYSTPRKINLGFIKLGHNLLSLDERDYLRKNLSLFGVHNLNEKILNIVNNFCPDLILVGHTNRISESTLKKIKIISPNIKIARLYIDSISKEFFKQNSKTLLNNINYFNKIFLTSKPNKFLKRYINKFSFIPNPVDSSVENLQNFKNDVYEYDLFFALSHGQNRVGFKVGKTDERDSFISYLDKKIFNIKKFFISSEFNTPKWGSEFYYYLSKSKMALNISRGSYQNLYSSDRIASLMGNGLLVFINKKTGFQKIFSNKEAVFFKNNNDLVKNILYYNSNIKKSKEIAKKGYLKYHKHFSSEKVCDFILNKSGLESKYKKFYWEKI